MELSIKDRIKDMDDPRQALDELASIFEAYNEVTERMSVSHQQLKDEVARLREELREKNELLERKSRLAALGEMAAGMAHEIRNPLGGVQLYASLLAKDVEDRPDSLKWVKKINSAVLGMNQIVTDMLTFTQNQSCEKTELNLTGMIAEVVDLAAPQAHQKDTRIIIDCDRDVIVNADLNMLHRILLNLTLNAIGAVSDNGVVVVKGRHYKSDRYSVRIEVSDNGSGIPGDVISKIFNPFFTTRDTGTGLGLAIVHRLVECHDGIITASNNQKTKGAIFTVLLP